MGQAGKDGVSHYLKIAFFIKVQGLGCREIPSPQIVEMVTVRLHRHVFRIVSEILGPDVAALRQPPRFLARSVPLQWDGSQVIRLPLLRLLRSGRWGGREDQLGDAVEFVPPLVALLPWRIGRRDERGNRIHGLRLSH